MKLQKELKQVYNMYNSLLIDVKKSYNKAIFAYRVVITILMLIILFLIGFIGRNF